MPWIDIQGRGTRKGRYWHWEDHHSERLKSSGSPVYNMLSFFNNTSQHALIPLSPEQKAENLKKLTSREQVPGAQLALGQSPSKKSVKITPSPLNSDLLELTNASMHARPSSWLEATSGRTPSSSAKPNALVAVSQSDLPELMDLAKTPAASPSKQVNERPKTAISNNSFSWVNVIARRSASTATPLTQETPIEPISAKK